jgi:coenzyme PQQ precursor peptide PqqA
MNLRRRPMAWIAPKIEEVTCGMEINMYFPAEDERDVDLF